MKNKKINLNKLSTILIILLIVGFSAPLSTTLASNGDGLGQGEQSGLENNSTMAPSANSDIDHILNVSDNVKQYIQTDVTPKGQIEQIRAQEQTIFQYRNMTMLMNCTRNATVTFTAEEEVTPKIFGLSVDPNQTMTLAMNLTKSPLNVAMVNERCLNFYLDIEPNAALELHAQIKLYINQTDISQNLHREVNSSKLTWMYWNQTRAEWESVESYMDQNGYLVCDTNHFSTWTVAEVEPAESTVTPSAKSSSFPIEYLVAGAVTVIAVITLGIIAYKKRK